ncbi:MAG: SH3 domain-containing protein [Elusimicrobiota bacterium]|jgi:SH3-like domain-containing protein
MNISSPSSFRKACAGLLILCAILASLPAAHRTWAEDSEREYMSIKPEKVSIREEPGEKAKKLWVLWKYSPVEVLSYRQDWARVRDVDGDTGWLKKSELSHTATVAARRQDAALRSGPGKDKKTLWLLDRGYPLRVFSRQGDWLEVSDLDAASGWMHVDDVWGAAPAGKTAHPEQ